MATCITCEEEYSNKRLELGYRTCLECGQADAVCIMNARNRQKLAEIAPSAEAGEVIVDKDGFKHVVSSSPDKLFDTRQGYNYDWRRNVEGSESAAE